MTEISSKFNHFFPKDITFVDKLVNGKADPSQIKTLEQYNSLYRIRHDAIHLTICNDFGIPFGEKKIYESKLDLKDDDEYRLIMNLSPDVMIINGMDVKVYEISITEGMIKARIIEKTSKYSLLIDVLKKNNYMVTFHPIVLSSSTGTADYEYLKSTVGLTENSIDRMVSIIVNFRTLFHLIHLTEEGAKWLYLRKTDPERRSESIQIPKAWVNKVYSEQKYKPLNEHDLEKFQSDFDPKMTNEDNFFMDSLVDEITSVDTKLNKNSQINTDIVMAYHHEHKHANHLRSFFPLPYLETLDVDSSIRSTLSDMDIIDRLKGEMSNCDSLEMKTFSTLPGVQGKISIPSTLKYQIALEGPGRKSYISKGSHAHYYAQRQNKSYWADIGDTLDQNQLDNDLEKLLMDFSEIKFNDGINATGIGINYVKVCQSIFREININAMRKDRRSNFILKPTGVRGVFVLIHKGPILRTGESISQIWFKIICHKQFININNNYQYHWAFKKMNSDKNILYSNWLSTDANRLDHYIRCYDKILMAYYSYVQGQGKTIKDAIDLDTSDTLGVILSIYMEDKRSTSKMLQDVRYLVMMCLSLYKYWPEMLEKFNVPLRTPLQAFFLRRILKFSIKSTHLMKYIKNTLKIGKINIKNDMSTIADQFAGIDFDMPRVLTKGQPIKFAQMLCEMYFTMLFNKNQDDPTHSSFQILSKMLEGENKKEKVQETNMNHLSGFDEKMTPVEFARYLINKPRTHQFSRDAIIIGSKLQAISQSNSEPNGLAYILSSEQKNLNKTLDEFATYKSSSVTKNLIFKDELFLPQSLKNRTKLQREHVMRLNELKDDGSPEYHEKLTAMIKEYKMNEEKELKEDIEKEEVLNYAEEWQNHLNVRRRCLAGVLELVNRENCLKSFDVIKKYYDHPVEFQVFKKNQIGGVREILILDMKSRILINVLETFSRNICSRDNREMLTHGAIKMSMVREVTRSMRKSTTPKLMVNMNFDKSRWGPSFMPIQFLYMFTPFRHKIPDLYRYFMILLFKHSNKKCLLPDPLVKAWLIDFPNLFQHDDAELQKLKIKFLKDKQLFFDNQSNMGQGILHYTSSLYHLMALSFRDELYKRCCQKFKITPGEWRDLVSSDDSYTCFSIPRDYKNLIMLRLDLFLKCQEVTERLFNIWTSKTKSSISLLIYEFNSLFGSNLTLFPTTFKFALSSVQPVSTDSFFRMVKESFNNCRQLFENGGSIELYQLAHRMNKRYCESIYHTNDGGSNDFTKLNLIKNNIPYQLGCYPDEDPVLMLMQGPECHNYRILDHILKNELDPIHYNIFMNSYQMVETIDPTIYAELTSFDTLYTGLKRIEAKIAPIRKLKSLRRLSDINYEQGIEFICRDPTILFRSPENSLETKIKIMFKLYQSSAAEALRTTAHSLYYGRVAASVSANAFYVPFSKKDEELKTFRDVFVENFIETKATIKLDDIMGLFPYKKEYDVLKQLSGHTFKDWVVRNPLEASSLRGLKLNETHSRIKTPIMELIRKKWINDDQIYTNVEHRDWYMLCKLVPLIKNSLSETLDQFNGTIDQRIRSIILILLRLSGYSSSPMKAIVYGQDSNSYDTTYLNIKRFNYYKGMSAIGLDLGPIVNVKNDIYSDLYLQFNYFILYVHEFNKIPDIDLDTDILYQYANDTAISYNSKKKIMIMAASLGLLDDVSNWTGKSNNPIHQWIVRQKMDEKGRYYGDFCLKAQLSSTVMEFRYDSSKYYITINENKSNNNAFTLLTHCLSILNMSLNDLRNKMSSGNALFLSDRIYFATNQSGVDIKISKLSEVTLFVKSITIRDNFLILLDDDNKQVIKTPVGLLSTSSIMDFEDDFYVNGVSFKRLMNLRAFDHNFEFDQSNKRLYLETLSDELIIKKPIISESTMKRLNLINWVNSDEKDSNVIYESLEEENITEDHIKKINDEDVDVYGFFTNDDFNIDDNKSDLYSLINPKESVYDWVMDDMAIDLGTLLLPEKKVFKPQIIWNRILYFKEFCVISLISDTRVINKSLVNLSKHLSVYCWYAAIRIYDLLYVDDITKSPRGIHFNPDESFLKKYNIEFDF